MGKYYIIHLISHMVRMGKGLVKYLYRREKGFVSTIYWTHETCTSLECNINTLNECKIQPTGNKCWKVGKFVRGLEIIRHATGMLLVPCWGGPLERWVKFSYPCIFLSVSKIGYSLIIFCSKVCSFIRILVQLAVLFLHDYRAWD